MFKEIDSETALEIVRSAVRIVGNLYPKEKYPINPEQRLEQLRIKESDRVDEVNNRIISKLPNLSPPYSLNREYLETVGTSTEIGTIVGIVIAQSTLIQVL